MLSCVLFLKDQSEVKLSGTEFLTLQFMHATVTVSSGLVGML